MSSVPPTASGSAYAGEPSLGSLSGPTLVSHRGPNMPVSDEDLVRHPVGMDWALLSVVAALAVMGIVMAFSASYYLAVHRFGDEHMFLTRHLRFIGVATFTLLLFANMPYQMWKKLAYPAMAVALFALVLVPIFGITRNRATRWLAIGGFSFQPAELAKVIFVAYLARSLSKKAERNSIQTFHVGLLPHFMVWSVLGLLCMKQPDLGTALVLAVLLFTMTFVAGARVAPLVFIGLSGVSLLGVFLAHNPMRSRRITAFIDNFEHRADVGYQLWNSKLAVAMGGFFGRGLGASHQKLGFVPEAHTDFVLAIVGEELGLVGIMFIAVCFIFLIYRGLRIALSARDEFGRLLAIGLTVLFGVQAAVNFGVVLGLLPTKGLTLPFVSYGGTSLIVMSMAAGILLNVGRGGNPDLVLPDLPKFGKKRPGNTRVWRASREVPRP
ncbi:MAG: putative lipid II flippase FtsW [Myxococcales bacterium]|nr:putative lipid II flippase FtsW [Myxococcales bacterium]